MFDSLNKSLEKLLRMQVENEIAVKMHDTAVSHARQRELDAQAADWARNFLIQSAGQLPPTNVPMQPGNIYPNSGISGLTVGQPLVHTPGARISPTGVTQMPANTDANPVLSGKPSEIIEAMLYCLRAKRAPFVWGSPGIGKSRLAHRAAALYYAEVTGGTVDGQDRVHDARGQFVAKDTYFADIRLVLLDPVDLRGLPRVVDGLTTWAPPSFLPQNPDAPFTVFFDELNRAPALVQNAALSILLDGHVGEWKAGPNVRFMAAGNRESDGGGVIRLNSAASDRVFNLNLDTDLQEWTDWANLNNIHPMVIAFLRFKSNLLNQFDRTARSWPNPRAWEFVSDIAWQQPARPIERLLVAGKVGEGAAIEYLAYSEMFRQLPSVDAIMLNPDTAPVPEGHEVGTLYALSAALASRAKAENFGRVLTYLLRLPREFLVFAIKDCTARDPNLSRTPDFNRFSRDNADLLA